VRRRIRRRLRRRDYRFLQETGRIQTTAVVLITIRNGEIEQTLDTVDSVWHYLGDRQPIVIVTDHEDDGTEAALRTASRDRLDVLRNPYPGEIGGRTMEFLTHKNAYGLRCAVERYDADFLLKLDTDALVTGFGLTSDILAFMRLNPDVGIFGRHLINADGTVRAFDMHTRRLNRELSLRKRLGLNTPAYLPIARAAIRNGWGLGQSVFGGAFVVSWRCLEAMYRRKYLSPPRSGWNSIISDDVYFSMCAAAAGFDLGHFAAPTGPLCLAWQNLPFPAREIEAMGYKVVHSVDKGANTTAEDNGGVTAREYFRALRRRQGGGNGEQGR
jgi:hypothetical protein